MAGLQIPVVGVVKSEERGTITIGWLIDDAP